MAKNIEPNTKAIGEYLKLEKETVFTIPEYQRAYIWEISHCDKLWKDISDYVNSDSKDRYFFGTIILNSQEDDTKLALIDGQQRTTTFLLLFKALLIRINSAIPRTNKDKKSETLCTGLQDCRREIMSILYKVKVKEVSYDPDKNRDIEICKNVNILNNFSINEKYKNELTVILNSYDYIEAESKVIKIPRKQKDNRYTNYFRNFKFFYEKIGELSESELNTIASAILEDCEVIEIKSWQLEQAITMFNSLNSDGQPLYDSDIISAKLYANAKKIGEDNKFTKLWEELRDLVSDLKQKDIGNIDSILMQHMYYERAVSKEIVNISTPGIRRYFTEINKDLLNNPIELCEKMINIAKIWIKVLDYPIIQVLLKFNENSKLFLASYFYRFKEDEICEDNIKTLSESMLRLFVILELVDTGYSSKYFKTFLFREDVKLVDANITEAEIKEDFIKHINEKWNKEFIKKFILDYYKNALVYLNEYLFAKEQGLYFNLNGKYDIEHIMPNSGRNIQEIRNDAGIDSEEEFKEVVNLLGNKILLEEKINRSVSNEWFRTKVSTKLEKKTGYINSVFPLAQTLVKEYENKSKPYWTKEDIMNMTEKASQRIVDFIFDNK